MSALVDFPICSLYSMQRYQSGRSTQAGTSSRLPARNDAVAPVQFTDLVGRKIVLQPNSGEFYSFLELATHYGLKLNDFALSFATGAEADEQFRQKAVDALLQAVESSLIQKEITQEAFRTFIDAYKAAAEAKGLS